MIYFDIHEKFFFLFQEADEWSGNASAYFLPLGDPGCRSLLGTQHRGGAHSLRGEGGLREPGQGLHERRQAQKGSQDRREVGRVRGEAKNAHKI